MTVRAAILLALIATAARALPPPTPGPGCWVPAPFTSWQIQFTGTLDQSLNATLYEVDLFDTPPETVTALHAAGHRVVCYLDAGTWEPFRPDASSYPDSVKGNPVGGFRDERWLDIRQQSILQPILNARLDQCQTKGFDGVDFDNVDGYTNATGFPLSASDQLDFDTWLANAAHWRGLAVALKNDLDQIPDLLPYFDWEVNEQCYRYQECDKLLPFVQAGKAVLEIEYNGSASKFCTAANGLGFNALKKRRSLGVYRFPCNAGVESPPVPCAVFPADNVWNADISALPVDPLSDDYIASIGAATGLHPDFGTTYSGVPNGIPYAVIPATQPTVPVTFRYADESDPGPYPIPPDAPIEGGPSSTGDRHVLVIDKDNGKLYEMFDAHPQGNRWSGGSGAVFDLNSNTLRPAGWTSADAAGLPIFPGLVRYDEAVVLKSINHALRFTVARSRRGYVSPARHFASSNTSTNLPPMGMRVRLKANFNISGFPPEVQVILKALKKYGMFVAANGSNWYVSGAPDPRWSDDNLHTLSSVKGSNFEVVKMGTVVTK